MKEKDYKKSSKENALNDERWIDVHNDEVMRMNGLWRPYDQSPRDPSVWTKTPTEKKMLKKYRCTMDDGHFHSVPRKIIRVRAKLIINLYKNNRFDKTTYSTECWQHEIPDILSRYYVVDKKTGYPENVVRKYTWNGKTYGPKELPFSG